MDVISKSNTSQAYSKMLVDFYNYMNVEKGDPRQTNTFWFGNPFSILALTLLYWASVRYFLPKYMETRKAYSLKTMLVFYNIIQMILCFSLLVKFDEAGYRFDYLWKCYEPSYSTDPTALKMLAAFEFTHVMKLFDLFETVFYCLRKKHGQVSFLHVYHHITTLWTTWWVCKYFGGGTPAFAIVINAYVHLFMYTYYLLSSIGGAIQLKVSKIKPAITIVQLIQLSLMVFNQTSVLLQPSCKMSKLFSAVSICNVLIMITLFRNFYKKAYRKTKQEETTRKVE